jgi:hypothetical protein
MMLDPRFKCLRLVIQYVGKEKAHMIIGEYDMYVLFSLLVHVYKVLNMSIANEVVVVASTLNNSKLNN